MTGLFKRILGFSLSAVFLIVAMAGLLHAQSKRPYDRCFVCNRSLSAAEQLWSFQETNLICHPCHLIKERCFECGVPVKEDFFKTSDGRIFCRIHKVGRVFDEYEAGRLYIDATDELRRIARGEMELKYPETPVRLFDVDYWNDNDKKKETNSLHKIGFSHTRGIGDRMTHGVVLLGGQRRQALAAVCAHEYAHLWINENRATTNKIDGDVVEAICELAAWKLMEFRNAREEMLAIESNSYTRGRILDLLKLEKQIGFLEVLKLVRTATNPMPAQLLTFTNAVIAPPSTEAATLPLWVAAPTVPGTLEVQGTIRQATSGRAVINGIAFAVGEEKSVPLGAGRLSVRCVEVTAESVFVTTNGSDRIELRLKKRP